MKLKQKKLKLNMKGRFQMFWNKLFLKAKMKHFGVDIHNIKEHNWDHVEIVLYGNKTDLWNVVKWTRNQDIFYILNEVAFEFTD